MTMLRYTTVERMREQLKAACDHLGGWRPVGGLLFWQSHLSGAEQNAVEYCFLGLGWKGISTNLARDGFAFHTQTSIKALLTSALSKLEREAMKRDPPPWAGVLR